MQKHTIGACPVRGYTVLDERDVIDTQIDLVLHGLLMPPPARTPRQASTDKTMRKKPQRR